jgi:hypothetical protein
MKKLFSTTMLLMIVSMLMITGMAGGRDSRPAKLNPQGGESQHIKLDCKAVLQSKTSPLSLHDPTIWYFHGYITNKTNKPVLKGTRVDYTFSSNKPGYFQGGVSVLKRYVILQEALPVNGQLFVGGVTFVTTNNPAQFIGKAEYVKWL